MNEVRHTAQMASVRDRVSETGRSGWSQRETVRLELARLRASNDEEFERALERVLIIVARELNISRVGFWVLDHESEELRCRILFDAGVISRESLPRLKLEDLGAYESEMLSNRVVAVDNALTKKAYRTLLATYFKPTGVVATLDAPIYLEGRVFGVLCHEAREVHKWNEHEKELATAASEALASLLSLRELRRTQTQLRARDDAFVRGLQDEAFVRVTDVVAGDLTDLLGSIALSADMASKASNAAALREQALASLLEASQSASRLCREWLESVRRMEKRDGPAVLDSVVQAFEPVLVALLNPSQRLEMKLSSGIDVVALDRAQIELALVQAVRHAVGESPTDTVVLLETYREDEHCVLRLSYEGPIPSPLQLAEWLDLFPIHAARSRHHGASLALARGIVLGSGGKFYVSQHEGKACFRLDLPLYRLNKSSI